jgi:hypothetical protein
MLEAKVVWVVPNELPEFAREEGFEKERLSAGLTRLLNAELAGGWILAGQSAIADPSGSIAVVYSFVREEAAIQHSA